MTSFCRHTFAFWLTCLAFKNIQSTLYVDAFTPASLSPAFITRSSSSTLIKNGDNLSFFEKQNGSSINRLSELKSMNMDVDEDDEDEEEEEEEEDPYMQLAESEFTDDFKSKSSALMMARSSIDWGGEIGKLRKRMTDVESGDSQNPSKVLYRLFSAKTPNQMIGSFVSTANPEVIQAMSGAVGSLLGGLSSPQMGIETIVRANGEKIGNLCFQLQMTGYMFRNAEYVVALKNIMKIKGSATMQDYRDAFDRLDQDKSGYIDAQEIEALLSDIYGGKVPSFEVQSFINYFDQNNDGKISWEEFERGLGTAMARAGGTDKTSEKLLPAGASDEEDDEDDDFLDVEPNVSGTIEVELKNGKVIEVEANEYIRILKNEARALQAALKREKGMSQNGEGKSGGPPVDSFTGITSYILERQGDLKSLTEGISPEVVDAMKMLVNFVIDGGTDGKKADKKKQELEMEIPGSALQQLALWQLVLGYRLREAEATGEYLKLLEQ